MYTMLRTIFYFSKHKYFGQLNINNLSKYGNNPNLPTYSHFLLCLKFYQMQKKISLKAYFPIKVKGLIIFQKLSIGILKLSFVNIYLTKL